jgi:hypothetical protein
LACASLVSVMVATPTSKLRLALRQVLADRRLLALVQLDVELREQHVEIGLRHAQGSGPGPLTTARSRLARPAASPVERNLVLQAKSG